MADIKAWKCANGHTLGQVMRNGQGVRQLIIYRQAIDEGETDEAPEVMATIEGDVLDVRCSICGGVRTWVMGQEALDRLIARVRSHRFEDMRLEAVRV